MNTLVVMHHQHGIFVLVPQMSRQENQWWCHTMSAVFSDYIVQYSLKILQRLGSYQIHYEPVLDSTYHTVNIIYCVHMKE